MVSKIGMLVFCLLSVMFLSFSVGWGNSVGCVGLVRCSFSLVVCVCVCSVVVK